jgi:hypothetical protein
MNPGNDPLTSMLGITKKLSRKPRIPTAKSFLPPEARQLVKAADPLLHMQGQGHGSAPSGGQLPPAASGGQLPPDLYPPAEPEPPIYRAVPTQAARERRVRVLVSGLLMVLAALVITGAAFLPWTRGTAGSFTGNVRGMDHRLHWYFSGWFMLGAAVIMVILGVVAAVAYRAAWAFVVGLIVAVVAGCLAGYLMVREAAGLSDLIREATGLAATGKIGAGLWLTLYGALLCLIGAVAGLVASTADR